MGKTLGVITTRVRHKGFLNTLIMYPLVSDELRWIMIGEAESSA